MSKLIIATILALAAMTADASCKTYIVNGEVITCCTYGSVINCL
jgi:hypothetical protein